MQPRPQQHGLPLPDHAATLPIPARELPCTMIAFREQGVRGPRPTPSTRHGLGGQPRGGHPAGLRACRHRPPVSTVGHRPLGACLLLLVSPPIGEWECLSPLARACPVRWGARRQFLWYGTEGNWWGEGAECNPPPPPSVGLWGERPGGSRLAPWCGVEGISIRELPSHAW